MVKAVFLDRDGVLNDLIPRDNGQRTAPWHIDEFKIKPHARDAVQLIKSVGYKTIVVTNQPDVNDGYLSADHLNLMNKLIKNWIGVDEIMCAYERNTPLYKPNNGMIEFFISKYKIDRDGSFLIGDRWKDIVAGQKSNLSTIYLGKEYSTPEEYSSINPDYIVDDVLQACTLIMELDQL